MACTLAQELRWQYQVHLIGIDPRADVHVRRKIISMQGRKDFGGLPGHPPRGVQEARLQGRGEGLRRLLLTDEIVDRQKDELNTRNTRPLRSVDTVRRCNGQAAE